MKPTVSVIIPCYNSEGTVGYTLASLKKQTYREWEAIVVDDGSTDNSKDVIKLHVARDPRFQVISQVNSGLASARNAGLAHARGQYICFLDADDLLLRSMLAETVRVLNENPRLGAVGCGWINSDAKLEDLSWVCLPSYRNNRPFPELAHQNILPCHAILLRRPALEVSGFFDCSLEHCQDWDLWVRVARAGTVFGKILKPLVIYRMIPRSLSRNAQTFFEAGEEVICRAHSSDERVNRPYPAFEGGCQCGVGAKAKLGWLWQCIGVAVAVGDQVGALRLFEKGLAYSNIESIFNHMGVMGHGLWFGAGVPKGQWTSLCISAGGPLIRFLVCLEDRLSAPGFAARCMKEIIDHSQCQKLSAQGMHGVQVAKALGRELSRRLPIRKSRCAYRE